MHESSINVFNKSRWLCPISTFWLKKILQVMLDVSEQKTKSITLYIVRDAYIALLNEKYLSCQGPTNILSFPAHEAMHSIKQDLNAPNVLILSVDTLQRECLLYGQNIIEHSLRLIAHGLGHVLGFDHGCAMWALCEKMENSAHNFLFYHANYLYKAHS